MMRTMKIRPGREPTSARTWGAARIPAARDGQDASAEHGMAAVHDTSAGHDASAEDASHAVAALYQLHYPALVRLAALLIPDLATAEDIVQDAFAAVHGRWHVQPDADAALAYLRWSVVHRLCTAAKASCTMSSAVARSGISRAASLTRAG